MSFLDLEIDTVTAEDLSTLRTESYYHINKDKLMDRIRYLLSKGLFNNAEPSTMDEVKELYDRLLDYKGATM